MTKKPLILVTNDDSIVAPGIRTLIEIANEFGEVYVVAPDGPKVEKVMRSRWIKAFAVRKYRQMAPRKSSRSVVRLPTVLKWRLTW